jgi:hypothetical protein
MTCREATLLETSVGLRGPYAVPRGSSRWRLAHAQGLPAGVIKWLLRSLKQAFDGVGGMAQLCRQR